MVVIGMEGLWASAAAVARTGAGVVCTPIIYNKTVLVAMIALPTSSTSLSCMLRVLRRAAEIAETRWRQQQKERAAQAQPSSDSSSEAAAESSGSAPAPASQQQQQQGGVAGAGTGPSGQPVREESGKVEVSRGGVVVRSRVDRISGPSPWCRLLQQSHLAGLSPPTTSTCAPLICPHALLC